MNGIFQLMNGKSKQYKTRISLTFPTKNTIGYQLVANCTSFIFHFKPKPLAKNTSLYSLKLFFTANPVQN
ncbi:hypothetical protein SAMN05421780_101223 [Flexibacter flexilis DSM 6793]|uniref:Uncharacterized protein n=1 Tax=Flexibacter flexilis DSM 6793 TaxID=927664 RepID=A0A1I1DHQ1_9BACT|nr:hypothetical protein SAMN05421780_101223 [Flexibacter flexilis DSM 6793]